MGIMTAAAASMYAAPLGRNREPSRWKRLSPCGDRWALALMLSVIDSHHTCLQMLGSKGRLMYV